MLQLKPFIDFVMPENVTDLQKIKSDFGVFNFVKMNVCFR